MRRGGRPQERCRQIRAAALTLLAAAGLASGGHEFVAGAQTSRAAPEAVERTYPPSQVKAAFLYHFGSYVRWPKPSTVDPITIAVLDAPAVARALERFVVGRTIAGRAVRVERLRSIRELDDEDLLFIGSEDNPRLDEVMQAVGNRPTLVVTDAPDGLAQGAMINFQVVDHRVRFEISLKRARAAGIVLSSRLLSAAFRVETTRCTGPCGRHTADDRRLAETGSRGSAERGGRYLLARARVSRQPACGDSPRTDCLSK